MASIDETSVRAGHGIVDRELYMASITMGWKVGWWHAVAVVDPVAEFLSGEIGVVTVGGEYCLFFIH
jgi:hypothetical protein